MTTRKTLMVFALTGFWGVCPPIRGDEPAKQIPELAALSGFVGSWDVEMTIKANANSPMDLHFKGSTKAKWTLNGRFIEQEGMISADDGSSPTRVKTLMTYDTNKKSYRSWTFFSTGGIAEYKATWDAKTKTLTSVSVDTETGRTSTITACFAVDGVESWTITETNRDGQVQSEIVGKNTRKKL